MALPISLQNPLPKSILKLWPHGNIMQLYGANPQWYNGRGHPGIDIAKARGSSVVSAHAGVVQAIVSEGPTNKYGNFATILGAQDSDGYQVLTQYGHLAGFAVERDTPVAAGSLIGYEGNSGFVFSGNVKYWNNAPTKAGNHLHFNVFLFRYGRLVAGLNGMNTVDPLPYLIPSMLTTTERDGEQFVVSETQNEARLLGQRELHTLRALGFLPGEPDPQFVARKPVFIIGDDE